MRPHTETCDVSHVARLCAHHTLASTHFALFQTSINYIGAGNSPTHFREFSDTEFAMISIKA